MTTVTTPVRLYELAEARGILDEFLAETDGELTPEIEALLDQLEGQVSEKVERVALYIREQLVTAAAIKEEEQRLAARRKARERAVEGLKDYLQRQMERLGTTKVDGLLCTVALQKSPPAMRIFNPPSQSELATLHVIYPEVVERVPETFVLNTKAVAEALKLGAGSVAVRFADYCRLEQGQHVRIR
jgi:hypothetical protein